MSTAIALHLPRPFAAQRAARLANAAAEGALAAAATAFAWPLILWLPMLTGPLVALAAGLVGWTVASAAARPVLHAANDNAPWPTHRIRAVGHRPPAASAAAG